MCGGLSSWSLITPSATNEKWLVASFSSDTLTPMWSDFLRTAGLFPSPLLLSHHFSSLSPFLSAFVFPMLTICHPTWKSSPPPQSRDSEGRAPLLAWQSSLRSTWCILQTARINHATVTSYRKFEKRKKERFPYVVWDWISVGSVE